jgi:protein SCO1/2
MRLSPTCWKSWKGGCDAYLVAAAARALRGLERPTSHAVSFLLKAVENIKYTDDAVSFKSYWPRWPVPSYTTAIEEIMKTLAWLGEDARPALPALEALHKERGALSAPAQTTLEAILAELGDTDTCHCPMGPDRFRGRVRKELRNVAVPAGIEMEDQDGRQLTFGHFFSGKPSIVVFFYTRCNNPNKCSLTISKLAGLQRALGEAGLQGQIQTAAITYDPDYDLPPRLTAYGENRGVVFSDSDRFLRTKTGFEALQDYFELGVNFGPTLVNRHSIELFVLDREARIAVAFTRFQWDVQDVFRHAVFLSPFIGEA